MRVLASLSLAATSILVSPAASAAPCHEVRGAFSTFTWCENSVTQMSPEARRAMLMPDRVAPTGSPSLPPSLRDLPHGTPTDAVFNWHDSGGDDWMTPVRNQKGCGSCFVFGALGAMESQLKVATGNPFVDVNLSEQSIISCISFGSCDNGGTAEEVGIHLESDGVTDEWCYPYKATDGDCDALCTDADERRLFIEDWHMSVLPWSEDDIKAQLVLTPIVAQMQVYTDFYGYTDGVYSRADNADADGWHVVTLVGWDDTDNSWIARNSWGDDWGDSGYFKVSREDDCNIIFQGTCFAVHINYLDVDPSKAPGVPCVTEREVVLAARQGEQDSRTVELSNCGQSGPVDVSPLVYVPWLSLTIDDDELDVSEVTSVTLVGDATSMDPGTYDAYARLRGGAGESVLHVTFEVEALPGPEPGPEPVPEPAPEPQPEAGTGQEPSLEDGATVPGADAADEGGPLSNPAANPSSEGNDDGCGCRVGMAVPSPSWGMLLALVTALAVRRRRPQ